MACVLGCLFVVLVISQANSAPVSNSLPEPLPEYVATGSTDMAVYMKTIQDAKKLFSNFTCGACKYAIRLLQDMFDSKMSFNAIADAGGEICYLATKNHKSVCQGIARVFKEEVLTVFSMVILSPEEVCAGYMKQCGAEFNPFNQRWNISIPGNKPTVTPVQAPKEGSPVTRILQLTDIHYDPMYTEGLSNECGEPLCCRPPNSKGSGKTAAGYWGDYNCDVPNRTIANLFENLGKMQDQFDWIYWTGDLTAHNIWNQTRATTLKSMDYFYQLFEKYLPSKTVFPTFGNHDTMPVNGFPQPFIHGNQSSQWILQPSIGNWSRWLSQFPNWDTSLASITKGGYYNVKVREGLRVIGLQTTFCEKYNFWLLVNATDPAGQLQWLADQLLEAERVGDKVHIIGHHPPGIDDSIASYADNYRRIVNRFESTIRGQFFGHTHTDFFKLYMDNDLRPTNVLYVSPGVTSYQGLNLGYRIYTIDGNHSSSTHAVLDHETYILDLDKVNNSTDTPKWEFEYSAKKAYNMSSLQPDSFYQLWKTMSTSNSVLQLFNKHWYKSRSGQNYNDTSILCDIVKTTLDYNPLCPKTSQTLSTRTLEKSYSTGDNFEQYKLTPVL